MTGNTLTTNPVTGTNAYTNGAYGNAQQGFWGNTNGFGVTPQFGFGTTAYQPQVTNQIGGIGAFTPQYIPQMIQQPGFVGQPTNHWQHSIINTPQIGFQGIPNSVLQSCPPQVLNTILQCNPPQVLGYILNALAVQQACQQVLAENPQAALNINPQAITQPFVNTQGITQPFLGYGLTNQTQGQFGGFAGFGGYGVGFQPQATSFLQQGSCVGCVPTNTAQQWVPGVNTTKFGFGQSVPQQTWLNTPYGTW